jgi:hypothetical protein
MATSSGAYRRPRFLRSGATALRYGAVAAIFISYRRGDAGWAGRLNDALEEKFPTFFDTRIEPGARWANQIRAELADCRVFLAVIGPDWIKKSNLRRLANDADWVRQEILAALGAAESRVLAIPLIVGGARWRGSEQLPGDLAAFGQLQWRTLAPEQWDLNVDDLSAKIEAWLAGSGRGRRTGTAFPPVLPFLCDRSEPQDALQERLAETRANRVFACVVHGSRLGGHAGFLDRLVHHRVLERHFEAQEVGVAVHQLVARSDEIGAMPFDLIVRRAIKRGPLQNVAATDDDLAELLRGHRPTVLVMPLAWQDWEARGPSLFQGLVTAWIDVFRTLSIQPRHPMILWINFAYPEDRARPDLSQLNVALPWLRPLGERDIADWIDLPDVKRYASARELKLLAIAGGKDVEMLRFVEAVDEILAA